MPERERRSLSDLVPGQMTGVWGNGFGERIEDVGKRVRIWGAGLRAGSRWTEDDAMVTPRLQHPPTSQARSAPPTCLRISYEIPGTDVPYGAFALRATRFPVLMYGRVPQKV
eukprot:1610013-Rhodomonas_salina.1